MNIETSLSAIVLAGGESRRMGRDKAWVDYGGKPLIQLAVEKIRALGVQEIFISGRPGEDYSAMRCPVLFDLESSFGPMGGIERGLHACTSSLLLVLAVDLPCMTTGLLQKLWARCSRWSGAIPKLHGELEPLAAIYPKRCHAFAFDAILQARRAVRDFVDACLREHAVRILHVSHNKAPCFSNWNTPADIWPASSPR